MSKPPYSPVLTSFDLTGALTAAEIRAVGLRSDERPAVKRGTLWYLDERLFGKGVGADDPFVRCRTEAGLATLKDDSGKYVRSIASTPNARPVPRATVPIIARPKKEPVVVIAAIELDEEDADGTGMGRGKRKRRASTTAMSGLILPGSPLPSAISMPVSPVTIPTTSAGRQWNAPSHRRHSSFVGSISTSAPTSSNTVPRLRLRLTNLEEVDSMDDSADEESTDVDGSRRKWKKKARRATSEGIVASVGVSTAESLEKDRAHHDSVDEEEDEVDAAIARRSAFSSASSSALLAQSLLAVSNAASPTLPARSTPHSAISPGSIHLASGPFHRPTPHHLSVSAPNLFTGFSSAHSPDPMEVDYDRAPSEELRESGDEEEDFHEAMLRGEDFDFEWGSESYTTGLALPSFSQKSRSKVPASIELESELAVEHADAKEEEEHDETIEEDEKGNDDDDEPGSTPATTPRSPAVEEIDLSAETKGGMDETLCEAFEEDSELTDEKSLQPPKGMSHCLWLLCSSGTDRVLRQTVDRVASTDSLQSLTLRDEIDESEIPISEMNQLLIDSNVLPLLLPSLLPLELPASTLADFSSDYDFVGREEEERSAYRNQVSRGSGDEDESEDEDEKSIKLEDEASPGPEFRPISSSRHSSMHPIIDSFARRLTAGISRGGSLSSTSSGSNEDDQFSNPHMVVSNLMLASGLPVPQPAPSPPEMMMEWGSTLDNDEFDIDINNGVDLLGPESVGLEELDLVWGKSVSAESHLGDATKPLPVDTVEVTGPAFLTRSLIDPARTSTSTAPFSTAHSTATSNPCLPFHSSTEIQHTPLALAPVGPATIISPRRGARNMPPAEVDCAPPPVSPTSD
jgi:hypothetical protein